MPHLITDVVDGTRVFSIDLFVPGAFVIEAYHLALLLGYSQQHAIRKQVLADWPHIFKEGVDYELVHDEKQLELYELAFRTHMGVIKHVSRDRGRMFLTSSGLRKLFEHTKKETAALEEALAWLLHPKKQTALPAPVQKLPAPRAQGAGSELEPFERDRQYQVLETLLDHLKHIDDNGLRKLAILSAELGIGRKLDDIRKLVLDEPPSSTSPPQAPKPDPATAPTPAQSYIANRPITGPMFGAISGVYYGLKQIGEKAGGYSAVQAGKAADAVAFGMGHSHDDIRNQKLEFNELPELPDNTSGKLRKMYRFNADFSNQVIVELRSNSLYKPGTPQDLGPFSEGGDALPNLSKGPFD